MNISTEVESKITTLIKGLNTGLTKVEGEVTSGEAVYTVKAYKITDSQIRIDVIRKAKAQDCSLT